MRFSTFIRSMFTAQSGISTKRVGGMIGLLAVTVWITYVTIINKEIPDLAEIFTICVFSLMGIDTIPKSIDAYRRKKTECKEENEQKKESTE